MKKNLSWFTLVELIVSITIFSFMMVSIFSVFFIASDLNNKIDVSRSMQENVKNIVEILAEDLRKNSTSWVSLESASECSITKWKYSFWSKICIGLKEYYLAKKSWNDWVRVHDFWDCQTDACTLIQSFWWEKTPVSNSWVELTHLNFWVIDLVDDIWEKHIKTMISFEIRPAKGKWVRPSLIEEHTMIVQTTLWERLYRDY